MPADVVEMDVVAGPEAEGARRATGASGPAAPSRTTDPDPEVPAKVQRRRFTAEYRLRIVKQADACKKSGELGALLRREGLYASHLTTWRRQREQGELVAGRARPRGPTPKPVDPRVKPLEVENRRLQRKLQQAETIITLQKNSRARRGRPSAGRETPEATTLPYAREEWPPAYWCLHEPVKKHGPGVTCAFDSGDAVRRSRLGK